MVLSLLTSLYCLHINKRIKNNYKIPPYMQKQLALQKNKQIAFINKCKKQTNSKKVLKKNPIDWFICMLSVSRKKKKYTSINRKRENRKIERRKKCACRFLNRIFACSDVSQSDYTDMIAWQKKYLFFYSFFFLYIKDIFPIYVKETLQFT